MFLSHVRSLGNVKENLKKLILTYGSVVLLLGYWILPILIHGDYHNISVWDGIWKFDSFGYREVLKNLLNGDLFDFGRLPILTLLVFLGVFSSLFTLHYSPFGLLFVFWLLLYFGRATWGGLFTLIPGMSEFHLSRFIVGVHAAGLFLIPIGFQWVIEQISRFGYVRRSRYARFLVTFGILVVLVILVYPQTLRYASHNDFLITQANNNYRKDVADNKLLIRTLRTKIAANPGRVFAGRGGAWGKDFRIAETPMYMHLSTYGIPVILWLPETWSPNSDTEQYFSENNPDHYSLYNVRYIVTPVTLPKESIQPFWKLTESGKTWKLYEVETGGYIAAGVRPAVVSSSKTDYRSLVRLWMHGGYIQKGLYPELTFDRNYPKQTGLPNFRMLDEVTYHVPDGSVHNLFAEVPRYISPARDPNSRPAVRILSQSNDSDMVFRAKVEVPPGCSGCITLLKQSYHPSWKAMINGKPAPTFAVFPFYIAVPTETAGTYDIEFAYRPSPLKLLLLFLPLLACTALLVIILRAGKRP